MTCSKSSKRARYFALIFALQSFQLFVFFFAADASPLSRPDTDDNLELLRAQIMRRSESQHHQQHQQHQQYYQQQQIEKQRTERPPSTSTVQISTVKTTTTTITSNADRQTAADGHEMFSAEMAKINEKIEQEREYKRLIQISLEPAAAESRRRASTAAAASKAQFVEAIKFLKGALPEARRRDLIRELDSKIENLVIERTHLITKLSQNLNGGRLASNHSEVRSAETRHHTTPKPTAADGDEDDDEEEDVNRKSESSKDTLSNSRLICQFFVFGTIFGVVCTISACTWSFSKCEESAPQSAANAASANSISRLTETPEPFDSSKPYCIKVDEKGLCYASPLAASEVPPLPSYGEALQMSRNIMTLFAASSAEAGADGGSPPPPPPPPDCEIASASDASSVCETLSSATSSSVAASSVRCGAPAR